MIRTVRRVVTGFDAAGRSVVVDDGTPGFAIGSVDGGPETTVVWSVPGVPVVPAPAGDPTVGLREVFPGPGGSTLLIVTHPPGSGVTGGTGMDNELADGLGADEHGMHASDTVDYLVVVAGRVWLELDDGVEVELGPGDVLVQNGTRHGWRNRGDADAVVAVVLLGAERSP
jgi:mannose-6-phosphate isomerase-like protein (cupin superfamily)